MGIPMVPSTGSLKNDASGSISKRSFRGMKPGSELELFFAQIKISSTFAIPFEEACFALILGELDEFERIREFSSTGSEHPA